MGFKQELVVAFSKKGKRENNEDFISPNSTNEKTNIYVLCDGVGGNNCGEIASEIVAKSISYYLNKKEPFLYQKKAYLAKSLRFAEERLSEYIQKYPESKDMATTVACLEFSNIKALGYWVGDSRIYQIRGNEILFKSNDHSLINKLLEDPNADIEAIKSSSINNYILRAVKGNHQPTKASTYSISNIKKNDYFVLTSDGITEAFTDDELTALLIKNDMSWLDLEKEIIHKCAHLSLDNYSIQIIKVTE